MLLREDYFIDVNELLQKKKQKHQQKNTSPVL